MIRSIRLRLTLWYALVLAVLLLAFSIIVYFLLSGSLYQRLDDAITLRAEHLAGTVKASINGGTGDLSGADLGEIYADFQIRPDEMAVVFDAEGRELAALGLKARGGVIAPLVLPALSGATEYFTSTTENGTRARVITTPIIHESQVVGALAFGRSTDEVTSVLDTYRNLAFAAIVVIILLAGGGGFFLTNRAFSPVSLMARTAREIGGGDLKKRIEVGGGGEIGGLANTLNQMFERLQSAFSRERRFTSDASHELRTPLAIIEAEATLTLERTRSKEEYKKALEVIAQQATHMSRLINDLLFLARSEAGREKIDLKPLRLGDFIQDLVSDASVLARPKRLKLQLKIAENPVVRGDETRLRQLFLNILENAVRYTGRRGTISVSVGSQESAAAVIISDTGSGIPQDALSHIFEPFFRADEGRAQVEGGTGLGLAIGQRIAETHGGRIAVESTLGTGSKFTVLLPVNEEDQLESVVLPKESLRAATKRTRPFKFLFWKF